MRLVMLALVGGSVAACASDVTAPNVQPAPENSVTAVGGNAPAGPWGFGRRGFGMGGVFAARRLPAGLQLSDAQKTRIRELATAFRSAHRDDLAALSAAMRQGRAARASGQTAEQRRALFTQTAPARQRLAIARQQLSGQIQQVLTADQRAWLAAHKPAFGRGMRRAGSRTSSRAAP